MPERPTQQTRGVTIRRALPDDLEVVVALRLRFLAEHRGVEPAELPPDFRATTAEFLRRQTEAGTAISWLADRGGRTAGVVTMLLLGLPPRPEDDTGTEGYIVNMYVSPAHRGAGIGRALLEACLDAARALPLRRVVLHATADGRPLYTGMGFTPNPAWMELRL